MNNDENNIQENNFKQKETVEEFNLETKPNNDSYSNNDKRLIILAGLLTFIPVNAILVNVIELINSNLITSLTFFEISSYLSKFIGIGLYFYIMKDKKVLKSIFLIILVGILLFNIHTYHTMVNMHGGLDLIGNALAVTFIYKGSLYIYYILSIILFIVYSKSFVFKPKIFFPLVISIFVFVFSPAVYNSFNEQTQKVKKNDSRLKTVEEFKNELSSRNLLINDGLLLGYVHSDRRFKTLDFDYETEEYPAYIFYGYKSEQNSDYVWIIYYINGRLYASLSKYITSNYPDSYDTIGNFLTESSTIYIYDYNYNKYETINTNETDRCVWPLSAYFNEKDSSFAIDFPTIFEYAKSYDSSCVKYEIVNKINKDSLDRYASTFTYDGYK